MLSMVKSSDLLYSSVSVWFSIELQKSAELLNSRHILKSSGQFTMMIFNMTMIILSTSETGTLYKIIWSVETFAIPPATDQRNIIGSMVRVVTASNALIKALIMDMVDMDMVDMVVSNVSQTRQDYLSLALLHNV